MAEFLRYLGEAAVYICSYLVGAISDPTLRLTAFIFVLTVVAIMFFFMFLLIVQLFKFVTSLFRRF